jgi:hypothetical protein
MHTPVLAQHQERSSEPSPGARPRASPHSSSLAALVHLVERAMLAEGKATVYERTADALEKQVEAYHQVCLHPWVRRN